MTASIPISPLYLYVRGRQLEGSYSADPSIGTWPITAARILRGWGAPSESEWPYVGSAEEWPPSEPDDIDTSAKARRLNRYQRVWSAEECCYALHGQHSVCASFDITDAWFEARNGEIALSSSQETIIGGHCVLMCGFDRNCGTFKFQNSWGVEWGNKGFGTMPFEYFDRHITEAWTMNAIGENALTTDDPGIRLCAWGYANFLGTTSHAAEIYDSSSDERIAWGFATERKGFLDVEELFVRPTRRRQGYGAQLLAMIIQFREKFGMPLRFWLPHTDCNPTNLPIVERMLSQYGYSVEPTKVRWAHAQATFGGVRATRKSLANPPAAPRVWRMQLSEA